MPRPVGKPGKGALGTCGQHIFGISRSGRANGVPSAIILGALDSTMEFVGGGTVKKFEVWRTLVWKGPSLWGKGKTTRRVGDEGGRDKQETGCLGAMTIYTSGLSGNELRFGRAGERKTGGGLNCGHTTVTGRR